MSVQNEELLEELMWIAYEKDMGIELVELAGKYIMTEKLHRLDAYEKAFNELGLELPHNI
jgi:hypothetical protein